LRPNSTLTEARRVLCYDLTDGDAVATTKTGSLLSRCEREPVQCAPRAARAETADFHVRHHQARCELRAPVSFLPRRLTHRQCHRDRSAADRRASFMLHFDNRPVNVTGAFKGGLSSNVRAPRSNRIAFFCADDRRLNGASSTSSWGDRNSASSLMLIHRPRGHPFEFERIATSRPAGGRIAGVQDLSFRSNCGPFIPVALIDDLGAPSRGSLRTPANSWEASPAPQDRSDLPPRGGISGQINALVPAGPPPSAWVPVSYQRTQGASNAFRLTRRQPHRPLFSYSPARMTYRP